MNGMDDKTRNILWGGILALAVALGIGRFAYTPLLPLMQRAVGFGDAFAGYLGSANYAGYLAGALWATWSADPARRVRRLRFNLLATIVSTGAMGLTAHGGWWLVLRFVSGATSAMVFILASGLVLEVLARRQCQNSSGWLYSGVGLGIGLSALAVPALDRLGGWQSGWLGLAGLSLLLSYTPWRWLKNPATEADETTPRGGEPESRSGGFLPWLVAAYFCEGLGYIVTGTFLVALLQRSAGLDGAGFLAWLLVGAAAAPSCVVWTRLGLRAGLVRTLALAHGVQAFGIVLPLLLPGLVGALGGAILFGGTFLGIAALTLVLGRSLTPGRTDRTIALLTAAFSLGQALGPALAGMLAARTRSFDLPLALAAATVALGAVCLGLGWLWRGKHRPPLLTQLQPGKE